MAKTTSYDCEKCGRLGGIKQFYAETKTNCTITVRKCSGCNYQYGIKELSKLKPIH